MALVTSLDRTAANISTLAHPVYYNEVEKWWNHISPLAGLFTRIGPKGYDLIGSKIIIAADDSFRGGVLATSGYLPEPETVDPINLEFTPVRVYGAMGIDNFLEAIAVRPGSFEDFAARLADQLLDAIDLTTARHIHGGSSGVVCKVTSRTSATEIVVEDGYNFDGTRPDMYLEPGMILASLDANAAYAVLAAAKISSIARTTSATTATITFASTIEGGGTIAAGDLLVFATRTAAAVGNAVAPWDYEYNVAPLGLLDIVDPANSLTTYGGATESSYQRINPQRKTSVDFGMSEIMKFMAEISAKSNSEVNARTHVLTMHEGHKIALAEELLPYQQQTQLGRDLQGGWQTVRIGEFDLLTDSRHLPSVVYALCPDDLVVCDVGGDFRKDTSTGNEWERLDSYDAKSSFMKWYGNRFAVRRNRMGALTSVSNPDQDRYSAYPG